MKDGQMTTIIPKWQGLNQINSILTGTSDNIDELNDDYYSIDNILIDDSDSYLSDLNEFRNKYSNITIANPNPLKYSIDKPIYITVYLNNLENRRF
jgi:hypothetical protein